MKRAFKNIPKVVRKQIWLRMAVGAVFLLFFITTWISTGQFRIGLMLLLFATLILVNGGVMIYNCVNKVIVPSSLFVFQSTGKQKSIGNFFTMLSFSYSFI